MENKKIYLTTEDGVEITNPDQIYYGVMEHNLFCSDGIAQHFRGGCKGEHYFSTPQARDSYIAANYHHTPEKE